MSFLVSSREGRLCLNGKRVPKDETPKISFNHEKFKSGDLSMPATKENILGLSQIFLDLFINPQGQYFDEVLNPEDKDGIARIKSLDVARKYFKLPPGISEEESLFNPLRYGIRNRRNLTKGWCFLSAGTLHRFFYKEYDLFRGQCEYDPDDYHWWLSDAEGCEIDLAEEQYRIMRIYDLRKNGTQEKPLGMSYGNKTRFLAIKMIEEMTGRPFDYRQLPIKDQSYKKKRPELGRVKSSWFNF